MAQKTQTVSLSTVVPANVAADVSKKRVSDTAISEGGKRNDTIFIREKTELPTTFSINSETFVPQWRVVTNFDRSALATSIETAKWYFFYLAGEMKATVLGTNTPATVRRAVKVILSKRTKPEFNSLEVTKILPTRFCGIPFLSVTANSRHIQERMSLKSVEPAGLTMAPAVYQ